MYALNYRLIVDLELPNDVLGVCFFSQVPDRDVSSLQLVVHVWPILGTLVLQLVDKSAEVYQVTNSLNMIYLVLNHSYES